MKRNTQRWVISIQVNQILIDTINFILKDSWRTWKSFFFTQRKTQKKTGIPFFPTTYEPLTSGNHWKAQLVKIELYLIDINQKFAKTNHSFSTNIQMQLMFMMVLHGKKMLTWLNTRQLVWLCLWMGCHHSNHPRTVSGSLMQSSSIYQWNPGLLNHFSSKILGMKWILLNSTQK